MKQMAAKEKVAVNSKQAGDRIRLLLIQEGAHSLPDTALRFFAEEYVAMVGRNLDSRTTRYRSDT